MRRDKAKSLVKTWTKAVILGPPTPPHTQMSTGGEMPAAAPRGGGCLAQSLAADACRSHGREPYSSGV